MRAYTSTVWVWCDWDVDLHIPTKYMYAQYPRAVQHNNLCRQTPKYKASSCQSLLYSDAGSDETNPAYIRYLYTPPRLTAVLELEYSIPMVVLVTKSNQPRLDIQSRLVPHNIFLCALPFAGSLMHMQK